jgi:preprotein translocase subunit SecB
MTETNDAGTGQDQRGGRRSGHEHRRPVHQGLFPSKTPMLRNPLQPKEQPKLDINVNVGAQPMGENQYEVVITLTANAKTADMAVFAIELVYAGLFRVTGVPEEHIHPFVLIECPRMLFPFARNILADASRNGGFPPLMLDPIDFAALYRQNMGQAERGRGPEAELTVMVIRPRDGGEPSKKLKKPRSDPRLFSFGTCPSCRSGPQRLPPPGRSIRVRRERRPPVRGPSRP